MSRSFKPIYLILLFANLAILPAEAGWLNPLSWFRKNKAKRVDSLIITGNYVKSRILAELIQRETKQPILLLPSGEEVNVMFFLTPTDETLEIKKQDYLKFIDFLQPKRALFLGNEAYSPSEYMEPLKDEIPVWSVTNNDWEKIVFSVGEFLKLKHLGFDYLVLTNQLDDDGRLKPASSTDIFGGYRTKRGYWSPSNPGN